MRVSAVAIGLVLASCAGGLGAEPVEPPKVLRLTLDEAVRIALGGGRSAVGARLTRDEQVLTLEREKDRYRPVTDVGATAYRRWRSGGGTRGDVSVGSAWRVPTGGVFRLAWREPVANAANRTASAELRFSQPLLKGFGIGVDTAPLRRARLRDRIAERAFRDRAGGIVVSVVSAWRRAAAADRRVAIARSALARARRQLGVNQVLVEAGRLASQDLVQAEAEVAEREYALIDNENSLEIAQAALVDVLDLEEGVRVELTEEADVEPVHPNLDESLATAFEHREDWLRAELGVELARIDVRVARNNRLWDLSLDLSVSRFAGVGEADYGAMLNLTVPLFDAEPRRALARARNSLRRAEMQRAETRQAIGIAVRRAVNDVEVALRRIELAGTARELAERKLEVERSKLREGLSSSFQIGRFENDLIQAENRELDATVGYRNARTALWRTLGTTLDHWGIAIERVGR